MQQSLLDLPISFFECDHKRGTFANVPSQQTTLRRIVSTRYYHAPVEAIRNETDRIRQDELKKQLPSFTPVALLRHRKKDTSFEERIINQWPMGTGDIDLKDNPGVDMDKLKQQIASLPYVLLCAYSVRKGLWFVVHLPDNQTPDILAAHFRYLQRLFGEKFGVKLDSTKGANPTALRFVAYDDQPYFNDNATVMAGTYTPPQPKRISVNVDLNVDEDSGKLLKRLLKPVENASEGQRHESLLKAARLGGGLIAANRLDEQTVILALETVASEWPMFSKSQRTIRDGIRNGLLAPVYPNIRERPIAWKVVTRRHKQQTNAIIVETATVEEWIPFDYDSSTKTIPPVEIESQSNGTPQLAVTTIDEQLVNPVSLLRPNSNQIEQIVVDNVSDYPSEWDEPHPKGATPKIKALTYFEWQCKHPSFSQLGIKSLNKS